MRAILVAVLLTAVSTGCERAPLTDLSRDAQEVVEGARMRANALRQMSAEELQELWAIEYMSLDVAHSDLAGVDDLLNKLGRERWECYHVSEDERGRVFYFKRNKSTLTAHLTSLLRLGAIAF